MEAWFPIKTRGPGGTLVTIRQHTNLVPSQPRGAGAAEPPPPEPAHAYTLDDGTPLQQIGPDEWENPATGERYQRA